MPPYVVRLEGLDADIAAPLRGALARIGGRLTRETGSVALAEVPATAVAELAAVAGDGLEDGGAMACIAAAVMAYRRRHEELRCGASFLSLRSRPLIMGIINCTPDSFWQGSKTAGEAAVERGVEMVAAGADLLDIGGESTRPGSAPVSAAEEIERVEKVIRGLCDRLSTPVSIDTTKTAVAAAAVAAGATMINDISGLAYEPDLAAVAAEHDLPLVLMHMRGRPVDMQEHAAYDDVVADVARELRAAIGRARLAGVRQVIVDPGIGFAKRPADSLALLHRLAVLRSLGYPVLVGPSRKSFIGAVLDLPVQERLEGTAAAVAAATLGGAHILRVHDVEAMSRVATVAAAIRDEGVE